MLAWLDWCCGIRDPLWGTLGWLAVIFPIWLWFWTIYLAFGPLGPCGKAWREAEGWPWPGERFWRMLGVIDK
jgi:hypothetical protein